MKPSRRITVVLAAFLVVCLAAAVFTVTRADRARPAATLQEVLYIPSGKVLRRMSLGYTGLLADIYWTRAVQYFGGKHVLGASEYKLLSPLLDITTQLDPHLTAAYEFGSVFLTQPPPNGAGDADSAVRLVQYGIQHNPGDWRLYYNLGFIYWMEKEDYKSAAEAFATGAKIPGAQPWMWTMAGSMAQGGDQLEMARTLWTQVLDEAKDSMIRSNARTRLACINSDEAVIELQKRVDFYKDRTGHAPGSFQDLVSAGLLRGVPMDPAGNPYVINSYGEVVVKDQKKLPFITKGLPHGEKPTVLYDKFVVKQQQKEADEKKKAEQQKSSSGATRPTDQK